MNWSRLKSATKCLGRCVSTQTLRPAYVKHKIPEKRASSLMNILRNEELQRLKNGREWPEIKPGDSISIDKKPYMTSTETETVKGVVIAKTNKQGDSALRILNVEYGTPIERLIPLYSPLIKNITVLQRAFIHKGKKRVRRSKLYYLSSLHPDRFTVK